MCTLFLCTAFVEVTGVYQRLWSWSIVERKYFRVVEEDVILLQTSLPFIEAPAWMKQEYFFTLNDVFLKTSTSTTLLTRYILKNYSRTLKPHICVPE